MSRRASGNKAVDERHGEGRHAAMDPLLSGPAEAIGQITTAALARMLGKVNARAARDWCQRHAIPYRRDGKHNWILIADVKRVLDNLPVHRVARQEPREDAAAAAVAALTGRR